MPDIGGSYLLIADTGTTTALAYNATAAQVASELNRITPFDPVAVSNWDDKSTNDYDQTQETGENQPNAVADQINGHPAVVCDGNEWLYNAAISLSQPFTFFVVASVSNTSPINPLFSSGSGLNFYGYGGQIYLYAGSFVYDSWALPLNEFVIYSVTVNGASSSIRRNGSAGPSGDCGATGISGLYLGQISGYKLLGSEFAVALFSGALAIGTVQGIEAFFAAQTGISLGHSEAEIDPETVDNLVAYHHADDLIPSQWTVTGGPGFFTNGATMAVTAPPAWSEPLTVDDSGLTGGDNPEITIETTQAYGGEAAVVIATIQDGVPTIQPEIQSVYVVASSGSFYLVLEGYDEYGPIAWNASAEAVDEALTGLGVSVIGSGTQADPWVITWSDDVDYPQFTAIESTLVGIPLIQELTFSWVESPTAKPWLYYRPRFIDCGACTA